MSKGVVQIAWNDDVALLTLNRPERRNAVDLESLELIQEIQVEAESRNVRALVLAGAPPAFCAGADLAGVREDVFHEALNKVLRGLTQMPCVTIAAIEGPALGAGAQLAVACDVRVATKESVIGVPAAKLGLVVNHWTIERIVREFSWPIARNMLLTATNYTAEDLHRTGSIHRLGSLDDALAWAHEIAKLAPLTIRGHKVALEATAGEPEMNSLVAACREQALASKDAQEGREAFLEKRQPKFIGS